MQDAPGQIRRIRLQDGTPVVIQRLTPDDPAHDRLWLRRQIENGYDRLSSRSRCLRFVSPPDHLAPWQLEYLTDLDPARGAIWVAADDHSDEPLGIGLARCMRLTGARDEAEIALTVVDAYQNKGLGRLFLETMVDYARGCGLRRLCGYVVPGNGPMLHLFRAFGADPPQAEDGLLRVVLPLR